MIVYVDGMDFGRTGIGRVVENVIAGLLESVRVRRVQTVVPGERRREFDSSFGGHPKIEAVFAPFGPFSSGDFLWKQRLIDRFVPRADLFFYPNMNIPAFSRGRLIFSINDIIMMGPESSWSVPKKILFKVLTGRALSRSAGVVFISEYTRGEVKRTFGGIHPESRVVYPCIGKDFLEVDPGRYRHDPLVSGEYILHVGIRVRHKNHEGLIRGWLEARKEFPTLKLVIVGKRLWEDDVDRLRREIGIGDEMIEFRDATDEEVKNLYANAKVFVFPSLAEGFGIPPLEAMAMGIPVVCADIPVLREVNKDAVVYADPRSPESIGEGVRNVLSDRPLRESLTGLGRARIGLFTRKRMMEGHLSFMEHVCRIR